MTENDVTETNSEINTDGRGLINYFLYLLTTALSCSTI